MQKISLKIKYICLAAAQGYGMFVCGPAQASQQRLRKLEAETLHTTNMAVTQECVKPVILTNNEKREIATRNICKMGLVCVSDRYVRREHLRLFLSFFLLLSPALEGDSSLSLAWLDILEELCWLKWLGTWRANPPWEAKLALQPPTTHCSRAQKKKKHRWFCKFVV